MRVISDHWGKKSGKQGLTVVIKEPKGKSRGFTVHDIPLEELYYRILQYCKEIAK